MSKAADQCLKKTLELAERMLRLADHGDAVRNDPSCGVVYGILRDSAYKLKQIAEAEQAAHLRKTQRAPRRGSREEKKVSSILAKFLHQEY